jgi:peptide/nickel transport system ATP-binding protein
MVTNLPANTATDTLLEVKNLNVDYFAANGTVHAVTGVSFSLRRGEILGLAGESGSGKSTLAYAITRLLRPPATITSGEIRYYPREDDDFDILQLSARQLRKIRWNDLAIVFQSAMNALNPVMTVGAQITDVLRTHRPNMGPDSRKQRAIELLQLVGIAPDRLRSYPHELSGGMRQRAIIAIALALSPEILIMDEPTTALDVVVQREILTEIMRLREKLNFAVIFITHDLSLLLELADNVAIMYAGRIVEQASTRDMYLHPRHPYSYGLLNSFPALRGPLRRMSGIPGSPPDLRSAPPGCAFHPRCPLTIDACRKVLPTLQPVQTENTAQMVACHLYNLTYSAESPTVSDLAKKYEVLAEGSIVR